MGSSGCGKTTLISCIAGVRKLDSGTIQTFGSSGKFQSFRTGFMPQDLALIENFKIKEIFWFFGMIYGMTNEKIEEKSRFLMNLLELPEKNRLVKNCSGGQQRRISFAVTLIHDPDLLILDEPTVGVDPLLRERIWNHLVELARDRNVTILLSTHYIEEARQSNQIGLMRNGVLIAEDSPEQIMLMCDTNDMDEAFLRLSQKQEICGDNAKVGERFEDDDNPGPSETRRRIEPNRVSSDKRDRKPRIMKALLTKHYLELSRNIG
jgi:ABC-type multidrug transport system ATPase subunit